MENIIKEGRTRREFLKGAGAVVAGGVVVGVVGSQLSCEEIPSLGGKVAAAKGYILVDPTECSGCQTCMMACSIAHYGKSSLSLARTQVVREPLASYPGDIHIMDCRQCEWAVCVNACPVGALAADGANGNVRTVDEGECNDYQQSQPGGCRRCVDACPYVPTMAVWNHEEVTAMTCDLCENTPYWDEEGGVDGKRACIEVCPASARRFTETMPSQFDESGYKPDFYEGKPWTREVPGWNGEQPKVQ